MRKQTVKVETGTVFDKLIVGELVRNVQDHPLFLTTPTSYLQHGRLRECQCECGETILYSENVLSSGSIKSCGCLKRARRAALFQERQARENKKIHKLDIMQRIRAAQYRLKTLQTAPIHMRGTPENSRAMADLGAELRKLFALKGHANRKNTNVRTT